MATSVTMWDALRRPEMGLLGQMLGFVSQSDAPSEGWKDWTQSRSPSPRGGGASPSSAPIAGGPSANSRANVICVESGHAAGVQGVRSPRCSAPDLLGQCQLAGHGLAHGANQGISGSRFGRWRNITLLFAPYRRTLPVS